MIAQVGWLGGLACCLELDTPNRGACTGTQLYKQQLSVRPQVNHGAAGVAVLQNATDLAW